jgi:hypothetical protein
MSRGLPALLVLAALLGPSLSSAQEPADAGVEIIEFDKAHPCYDIPAETMLVPKPAFDAIDKRMRTLQAQAVANRVDDNTTKTALIMLGAGAGVGLAVGIVIGLVVHGFTSK